MLKFIAFWLVSPWGEEEEEEETTSLISQEQRVWPTWSNAGHNNDPKKRTPAHIYGALPMCWALLDELDLC